MSHQAPFLRKPAKPFVLISDVDGTIMVPITAGEKIPYTDGDALLAGQKANQGVVERLLALEHSGFLVRFCSGRSEHLREVTVQQLEAAGFKRVDDRLMLQDEWQGWDQLLHYKAYELADWEAVLHVGDQDIDRKAAELAGAAFIDAKAFGSGDQLQFLFCWQCGCTEVRACGTGCWWINGRLCSSCHRGPNAQLKVMA